ncbi:MAG: S41 family peptidase [Pseudomonadota bacterium]|nr:S41 family peptidase [Pseudomonadota bacterium]
MRAIALLVAALLWVAGAVAEAPPLNRRQYAEDFDVLWKSIDEGYAYFERGRPAWRRARDRWRPRATHASSRAAFVAALEGALEELSDDHVSLSERTPESARRVPADTDVWARWRDGVAVVEAVRIYGNADAAGLRPGHVITKISGVPVERAVRAGPGPARDRALRQALAGPRTGTLRLEVREPTGIRSIEIERDQAAAANGPPLLGRRIGVERDLGYIRIKGGLGDPRLVAQFDAALSSIKDTRALILDLREVAGSGTAEALRAILSRFVSSEVPWQQRERRGQPRAVDTVAPREWTYRAPLVVLVDRWTAGDGEALAAGLHAAANARLVGSPMAGLRGIVREVRLPQSAIALRFPAERALLPDGTPRESIRPGVAVDLAAPQGGPGDPILYQALKLLEKK